MERDGLEATARYIMDRADMLVLATTAGEEYPYQRALFNLRNKAQFPGLAPFFEGKGLGVYLGTNTSSIKVAQLGRDAWASAYFMIPGEFMGICLSGRAVPDSEAREAIWVEGWERYYPAGRGDPDYSLLRIDPVRARGWCAARPFDFEL